MRGSRNLAILGLLLAFLGIFLSWFSNGANLISLYYHNGALDFSPVSSPSNQFVTVTFILYPIALLVALWAVWTRRSSPWQGLIVVPAVVYLIYQRQESYGFTDGPLLTLVAGMVLAAAYFTNGGSPEIEYRPRGHNGSHRRGPPDFHLPSFARRFGGPLWAIVGIWILLSLGFYSASLSDLSYWIVSDLFGVIAGAWVGFRYYFWVGGIHDRATLFLVAFGSLALAFIIAGVFITPYAEATSSFNQFFGIHYSGSDVGLASSMAAFGTPLVLMVGFSILYAGYKASRTIFVRFE